MKNVIIIAVTVVFILSVSSCMYSPIAQQMMKYQGVWTIEKVKLFQKDQSTGDFRLISSVDSAGEMYFYNNLDEYGYNNFTVIFDTMNVLQSKAFGVFYDAGGSIPNRMIERCWQLETKGQDIIYVWGVIGQTLEIWQKLYVDKKSHDNIILIYLWGNDNYGGQEEYHLKRVHG